MGTIFNRFSGSSPRSVRKLTGQCLSAVFQAIQSILPQPPKPSPSNANWSNFIDNHIHCWNGLWTSYKPSGDLIESCLSERKNSLGSIDEYYSPMVIYPVPQPVVFYSVPDLSTVNLANTYFRVEPSEQTWQLRRSEHSSTDGIHYPEAESQRGLFLANGMAAICCSDISASGADVFEVEILFRHDSLRIGVGIVFSSDGLPERFAIARESTLGANHQYFNVGNARPSIVLPSALYYGEQQTVSRELEFSSVLTAVAPEVWEQQDSHRLFGLPDGVIVRYPQNMQAAVERVIEVLWPVRGEEGLVYQASLVYKADGRVKCFSGGLFKKDYGGLVA